MGWNTNSRLSENLHAGDYAIEATTYYARTSGDFTRQSPFEFISVAPDLETMAGILSLIVVMLTGMRSWNRAKADDSRQDSPTVLQ